MKGRMASLLLRAGICGLVVTSLAGAAEPASSARVGTAPAAAAMPKLEFAFEAHVTLAPAVVLGETAIGQRQFIPITGGVVSGPKFRGEVVPGGWDFQLRTAGGCNQLTADYFWRAQDGVVIHILNEGLLCPEGVPDSKLTFVRPRFEAPKGPHEWMTRATFIATLEVERAAGPQPRGAEAPPVAVRIKFFQLK
ncbi:MAG: DUF3237 domain-containing protein [Pseudomonadota bacterium]|nr:DUF3237 domain-containing protein [Pseudomonadota bacterium]